MKPLMVLLLLLCAFLISGCPARSIHPLFTEPETQFLLALIDTWQNNDESYTFEPLQGKVCRLTIRSNSDKDSSIYQVRTGMIGKEWYLDSSPIVSSDEHHYLSTHLFTAMSIRGDTLRLATLEGDWLLKRAQAKTLNVPFVQRENEVVLTGTPKELQRFIAGIDERSEAFPEEIVLVRTVRK